MYDVFNPATVEALMCRFQISVDYDGKLYDCDFNLAAGLPIFSTETIADWIGKPYTARKIRMDKHALCPQQEPVQAEAAQQTKQAA